MQDFLLNMFCSKVFQTVIAGIIVFIISQYFLELYLKPKTELKKLYALLSEKLLSYQKKIVSGKLTIEQIGEIKDLSARLLVTGWAISYRKARKNFFVDISQNINGLISANELQNFSEVNEYLKKLKKCKNIKVTYEEK